MLHRLPATLLPTHCPTAKALLPPGVSSWAVLTRVVKYMFLQSVLREFHAQTSLAGHSPWAHKESNMTERLTLYTYPFFSDRIRIILCIGSKAMFWKNLEFLFLICFGPRWPFFVRNFDDGGTLLPPRDRNLNCNLNTLKQKDGREGLWPRQAAQSFLEVLVESGQSQISRRKVQPSMVKKNFHVSGSKRLFKHITLCLKKNKIAHITLWNLWINS